MNDNQLPDDEWDYYSGLPSPTWYERKANGEDEFQVQHGMKGKQTVKMSIVSTVRMNGYKWVTHDI